MLKMQHVREKMRLQDDKPWENEEIFMRNLRVGRNSRVCMHDSRSLPDMWRHKND